MKKRDLTPRMLRLLKALHEHPRHEGVAPRSTAVALQRIGLVTLDRHSAYHQSGAQYPQYTCKLTDKGQAFSKEKFC